MVLMVLTLACAAPVGQGKQAATADRGEDSGGVVHDSGVPMETWFVDEDGDGHGNGVVSIEAAAPPPAGHVALGDDCDDTDPHISPSAPEICGNGHDDNCDGGPGDCPPGGRVAVDAALRLRGGEPGAGLGAALAWLPSPHARLLVGAPGAGRTGEGAVLMVDLEEGSATVSTDTHAAVVGPLDQGGLGTTLQALGDGFAAGAPDSIGNAGAVLIFDADGGELARVEGRRAGDRLGTALSLGEGALLLGVPDDVTSGRRGAVERVSLDTTGPLSARSSLRIEGTSPGSGFGGALSWGDLDGDGLGDLVVGAASADEGRVLIFAGPVMDGVESDAESTILGGASNGALGTGVCIGGDIDGNGTPDLLVSAPAGGVLVRVDGGAAMATPGVRPVLELADGRVVDIRSSVGHVAPAGDLDGDGLHDVIAAGPHGFWGPLVGVHSVDDAPLQLLSVEAEGGISPPGWIGLGLPAEGGSPFGRLAFGGPTLEVSGTAAGEVQVFSASGL